MTLIKPQNQVIILLEIGSKQDRYSGYARWAWLRANETVKYFCSIIIHPSPSVLSAELESDPLPRC